MNIQQMRNFVSNYYGEDKLRWQEQVARMGDDQVTAIYYRMIEPKPQPKIPPLKPPEIKETDDDAPTLF